MFLERLFGATLEDPRFSLQDQMAVDIFGGPPSDSGVRVNNDTANTYSPWFRGINLISRDVARLPLQIFENLPDDDDADNVQGKRPFIEHPSYSVVRRKANSFQTAFQFKLLLTSHALSKGNGYGYIARRADGSVLPVTEGGGITPMDPAMTHPVKETIYNDVSGELISARTWYVTRIKGQDRKIASDDILHIRGMGFDGLTGYDVVTLATNTIGRGMAHQKYANKFYSNGAHLKVVLETPNTIKTEVGREIVESWNRMQAGIENAHRTAILHSGLKANNLTSSARDAQFIEGEEFNIRFVANFLGIPPHKLGAKTGESYASKEQENLDYLFSALSFWLEVWQDECWDKLLTEKEKEADMVHVGFDLAKLYEADLNTKATYWRTALAGQPWATVDEARSAFNLNPKGMNEITTPLNMGQGGIDNQPKEPAPPGPPPKQPDNQDNTDNAALRAAIKTNLRDAVRRVVRRIGNAAERADVKPATFCDWLDKIPDEHGKVVAEMLSPSLEAAAAITGPRLQTVLADICAALLEFSGRVTPKTMAAELPKEMARLEMEIPAMVVALFFGE